MPTKAQNIEQLEHIKLVFVCWLYDLFQHHHGSFRDPQYASWMELVGSSLYYLRSNGAAIIYDRIFPIVGDTENNKWKKELKAATAELSKIVKRNNLPVKWAEKIYETKEYKRGKELNCKFKKKSPKIKSSGPKQAIAKAMKESNDAFKMKESKEEKEHKKRSRSISSHPVLTMQPAPKSSKSSSASASASASASSSSSKRSKSSRMSSSRTVSQSHINENPDVNLLLLAEQEGENAIIEAAEKAKEEHEYAQALAPVKSRSRSRSKSSNSTKFPQSQTIFKKPLLSSDKKTAPDELTIKPTFEYRSPKRLDIRVSRANKETNPYLMNEDKTENEDKDLNSKNEEWLIDIIQHNRNQFLQRSLQTLKRLNQWKIEQYNKLMIRKAGNVETAETIIKTYKEDLKNEETEKAKRKGGAANTNNKSKDDQYTPTEKYVIELWKHRELVLKQFAIPAKAKHIKDKSKEHPLSVYRDLDQMLLTKEELQARLLNAINDPNDGIKTLTGQSRESLRKDLIKTIYSLQSSNSSWKRGNNIIIVGESGSGKTKACNVIGYVYSQMGVMATSKFADVISTSLIADHVGGTAKLTESKLLDSLESTILIDEIYRQNSRCDKPSAVIQAELEGKSIPQSNEAPSPFGMEAITQMVAMLAELRGLIVVIVAGYAPNIKCWLTSNDGLERRFLQTITLEPYTANDFTNMFMKQFNDVVADDRPNETLNASNTESVRRYVLRLFQDILDNDPNVLKRQAGDVDIIAAYFAQTLANLEYMELQWPQDVLYVILIAFHRFLRRSHSRFHWEFPVPYRKRKSASVSKLSKGKRTGGFTVGNKDNKQKENAFLAWIKNNTRLHCYTPDTRIRVKL